MPIPSPNLDDRRFQDFVDDAKRLLQRRIPAWTDHNVHDPGVTLIEAVATMADQLTYRFNQMPERHYRKFLDLLGIKLRPPTAARADLTFRLSARRPEPVVVPAGTVVSTRRKPGEQPVSFTTLVDLSIPSVSLAELRAAPAGLEDLNGARDLRMDIEKSVPTQTFSEVPRPGDKILIGLTDAAPRGVVLLRTDSLIEGIGVDPTRPPLRWEAMTPSGWAPCEVEEDSTGGLNRPGDVVLHLPAEHAATLMNGVRAGWLRAMVTEPAPGVPPYTRSPSITRMAAACMGATTRAIHATHTPAEVLGMAEGSPGQRFSTERRPILAQPEPVLEVAHGDDGWVRWEPVADFAGSGRDDRHYVLDRMSGTIEFGPAVRLADGSIRAYGAVPAEGAGVRLVDYWSGGGVAGNVRAGSLTAMRGSIPFVKTVTNRRPAAGGRDGETVDEAKQRAPQTLRTRDRAVSAEDFEVIATRAAGGAVRVKCVAPAATSDPIRVLVVPDVSGYGIGRLPFPALTPDNEVLRTIAEALDTARLVGVRVVVEPAAYRGVTVAVRVRPKRHVAPEALRDEALAALYRYLHPWVGGPDGTGWPFGRPITAGDVHAALSNCEGLDYVEEARLFPADPTTGKRDAVTQRVEVGPEMLPFSYDHQVQVRAQ